MRGRLRFTIGTAALRSRPKPVFVAGCRFSSSAAQQGCRLLRNVHITAELAKKQAKLFERIELTAETVLEEIRRIGFSDLVSFYTDDGNLKDFTDLTPEQRHVLAASETFIMKGQGGRRWPDRVQKIKLHDKMKALETLAKHFKLADEGVRISFDEEILARLQAGRARAARIAETSE